MRIQKFDKDGKFLLSFGGAGSGDGQFQALLPSDNNPAPGTGPGGIAVDSQGNVYVADTWNHRMQKFDRDGKFIRQWGGFINLGDASTNPTDAQTKFFGPRGVAVDAQNNVYVTDTGNRRVMEFDGNGTFLRQFAQGLNPGAGQRAEHRPEPVKRADWRGGGRAGQRLCGRHEQPPHRQVRQERQRRDQLGGQRLRRRPLQRAVHGRRGRMATSTSATRPASRS